MRINRSIITFLNLKQLGRKKAFGICGMPEINTAGNQKELVRLLDYCHERTIVQRLKRYSEAEVEAVYKKADEILESSLANDIRLISYFDADYPAPLRGMHDPPLILNVRGDMKNIAVRKGVAVIGTREPHQAGYDAGGYFSRRLSSFNFNIVSGLAKGCDTAAHRGCLEAGGITTAVLAHGLDMIYPDENKILSEQILECGGLLMSEYFVKTRPFPGYFAERDRIQAGLSAAAVVIQSGIIGGTMHTVNAALINNKLVAAVKYGGGLNDPETKGNEMLISEGKAFPLQKSNLEEFVGQILQRN